MTYYSLNSVYQEEAPSSWNWQDAGQAEELFNEMHTTLFSAVLLNESELRRLSGPVLGVTYVSFSLIARITDITEHLLKGLGNLFGSLIPDSEFSFKKGIIQIALATAKLIFLPLTLTGDLLVGIVILPLLTLVSPNTTTKEFLGEGFFSKEPKEQNAAEQSMPPFPTECMSEIDITTIQDF